MKGFIHDIWWMMLLRGIALLLLGVVAVAWPGLTFVSLAVFLAVYVLVAGTADILVAIGAVTHKRSWFLTFILGTIEIALGVYLFKNPILILPTFIFTVGAIFIAQGIVAVIVSFIDTADPGMRLLEIVGGILGIIAGFVVLQYPVSSGIAFVWVLGLYGLIAGTLSIASALSLRNFVDEVEKVISPRKAFASK